jgi:hypothetical protein
MEYTMRITKTLSALSLAFALVGGAAMLTPSSSHAAPKKNSGFIDYGALKRGQVPCNKRGASASNCREGKPVNEYKRGCSKINRCRG